MDSVRQDTGPVPLADAAAELLARLRQRRCPLLAAAVRLADPAVLAVVQLVHPPEFCPAARREAA